MGAISKTLNWVIVVLFALLAFGPLASGGVLSAVILWLVAILISPPVAAYCQRTFHLEVALWAKILIGAVGLILAVSVSGIVVPSPLSHEAAVIVENVTVSPRNTTLAVEPPPTQNSSAANVAATAPPKSVSTRTTNDTPLVAKPIPAQNVSETNVAPIKLPAPASTPKIREVLAAWANQLPTVYTLGDVVNATPGPLDENRRAQEKLSAEFARNAGKTTSVVTCGNSSCLEGYQESFLYSYTLAGDASIYRFTSPDAASKYYNDEVGIVRQARGYSTLKVSDNCFAWSIDHYLSYVNYNAVCLNSDIVVYLWYNDNSGDAKSADHVLLPSIRNLEQRIATE